MGDKPNKSVALNIQVLNRAYRPWGLHMEKHVDPDPGYKYKIVYRLVAVNASGQKRYEFDQSTLGM